MPTAFLQVICTSTRRSLICTCTEPPPPVPSEQGMGTCWGFVLLIENARLKFEAVKFWHPYYGPRYILNQTPCSSVENQGRQATVCGSQRMAKPSSGLCPRTSSREIRNEHLQASIGIYCSSCRITKFPGPLFSKVIVRLSLEIGSIH